MGNDASRQDTFKPLVPRVRKILVVLDIDIGAGQSAQLEVYEGDSPFQLATNFCLKHSLLSTFVAPLAAHIERVAGQQAPASAGNQAATQPATAGNPAAQTLSEASAGTTSAEESQRAETPPARRRTPMGAARPRRPSTAPSASTGMRPQLAPKRSPQKGSPQKTLQAKGSPRKASPPKRTQIPKPDADKENKHVNTLNVATQRKGSIFDRLYNNSFEINVHRQEAERMLWKQREEEINATRPPTPARTKAAMKKRSALSAADRLHLEAAERDLRREALRRKAKEVKEKELLQELTLVPQITERARRIRRGSLVSASGAGNQTADTAASDQRKPPSKKGSRKGSRKGSKKGSKKGSREGAKRTSRKGSKKGSKKGNTSGEEAAAAETFERLFNESRSSALPHSNILKLRRQLEEQERAACTFKPAINPLPASHRRPSVAAGADGPEAAPGAPTDAEGQARFERLYRDAETARAKRKVLADLQDSEITHRPNTGKPPHQPLPPAERAEFFSRLSGEAHEKARMKALVQALREESKEDLVDERTGQRFFSPRVGRPPVYSDRPREIHQHLYGLHSRHQQAMADKQKEVMREDAELRQGPGVRPQTLTMVEKMQARKLRKAFDAIADEEGWARIDDLEAAGLKPVLVDAVRVEMGHAGSASLRFETLHDIITNYLRHHHIGPTSYLIPSGGHRSLPSGEGDNDFHPHISAMSRALAEMHELRNLQDAQHVAPTDDHGWSSVR